MATFITYAVIFRINLITYLFPCFSERRAGLHAVEVMRRGIQKTAKREAKKKSDLKFKQQLSLTLACFSEEKSKESQNRLLEEKRILKSVLEDFVEAEEKLHSDIDSVFTSASQTTIRNVVEGPLSGFTKKIRDKLLKIDDDIARM